MKTSRRLSIIVCIGIAVVVLTGTWWAALSYLDLRVRVALAEEQIRYFEEAVQEGISTNDPTEIAAYIQAIRAYYPSGTKQRPGSHLDSIVERTRSLAIERLDAAGAAISANGAFTVNASLYGRLEPRDTAVRASTPLAR